MTSVLFIYICKLSAPLTLMPKHCYIHGMHILCSICSVLYTIVSFPNNLYNVLGLSRNMGVMVQQHTEISTLCSIISLGLHQRKYRRFALLTLWEENWWVFDSSQSVSVIWKSFLWHDVIVRRAMWISIRHKLVFSRGCSRLVSSEMHVLINDVSPWML